MKKSVGFVRVKFSKGVLGHWQPEKGFELIQGL